MSEKVVIVLAFFIICFLLLNLFSKECGTRTVWIWEDCSCKVQKEQYNKNGYEWQEIIVCEEK